MVSHPRPRRFVVVCVVFAGLVLGLLPMTSAFASSRHGLPFLDSVTELIGGQTQGVRLNVERAVAVNRIVQAPAAPAATASSIANGSWGSPGTWDCNCVPDATYDVTINNTVTLDTTRSSNNLTINPGGTLDLLGNSFNLSHNGTTFTNNGTLADSGAFNIFFFLGNGGPGQVTETIAGNGSYSGNLELRLNNAVTVNFAPSTTVTFTTATNNANFGVDASTTLDVTNALNLVAPSAGANYVIFSNSGTITGAGGLKVQGNVNTQANTPIGSPFEVVSGASTGYGTFGGSFKIDSGSSFKLSNTATISGDLTIQNNASLDLNGSSANFNGNLKTFTNNGTVDDTGAFNTFFFVGNGGVGGVTQTFVSTGTYSGNMQLRLNNTVTVNVAPSTTVTFTTATNNTNFTVDAGTTLDVTNALNFVAPSAVPNYVVFTNNGTITGPGGLKMQGNVNTAANSPIASPFEVVSGASTGYGTFNGLFIIDSNASFKLANTLAVSGDLTIQSNAVLDMSGSQVHLTGNGKTFTNSGSLTDTGAANTFFFAGNGGPGNITETLAGTGTYGTGVELRLNNAVTVITASGAGLNGLSALTVDAGTTLDITNGLTVAGPPGFLTITDNGTITGGTLQTQGNVQLNSGGVFNSNLDVFSGTTRTSGTLSGTVSIDNTGTLKLTGTLTFLSDLTINGGGTLDMAGQVVNFNGNLKTFTNNGLVDDTGAFNEFRFNGNGGVGGITETLAGNGSYSGNMELRLNNVPTVNVAPSTTVTFITATNSVNFGVDASATLNVTNALNFVAPSAGPNYVGFTNGGTVTGAGGLKVQGNVNTAANSAIASRFEVVSGSSIGYGNFSGLFIIDSNASFKMAAALSASGDLTIQSNAVLDMAGSVVNFTGNGKTFTNNGTLTNTGVFNTFFFVGSGAPNGITQHIATSAGTVSDNLLVRLNNVPTVILDGDAQLGSVQIDASCTLDITNHTLKLSAAGTPLTDSGILITSGSTVEMDGTAPQNIQTNLNGAQYYDLSVSNPAGATLANPITATHSVAVKPTGVLKLTGGANIGTTPTLRIDGNGAFDITGVTAPFALSSSTTLSGTGIAAAGTIAMGGFGMSTGATSPITLAYANGQPTLVLAGNSLTLSSGEPVTVNTTSVLAPGNYVLIAHGTGAVTGSAPTSLTVGGSGLCAGCIGSLAISNQDLVLQVPQPPPTINVSTNGPLNFGSITVGNASASQSYTVAGSYLQADIVVNAPAGFQVSKSPNSGFGGSVTLTQSGGTVNATTIYVRFTPVAPGAVSPTVDNTSTNATPQGVTVTGNGVAASCAAQPAGMVAWYPGENNALDIRGGNDGTLQNGTAFGAGKVGQAFSFNGTNQYVTSPDSPNWDFGTGDFTLDSWINSPNPTGVQRIISAGIESDGANNLWALGYGDLGAWGGGTRLDFAYWNGSGYVDIVSDPITLNPNEWYHVAVVRSGAAMTFYLNGAAVGGGNIGAVPINGGTTGGMLGARRNVTFGVYEFANGMLDEVEVFKRGLTASEIGGIYNASTAGKCTLTGANAPTGWWAGDGDAKDSSGNGHNGTLQNSVAFTVGKVGQAFGFNSGPYVDIPTAPDLNPGAGSMSLDAWIYPTADQVGTIVSKWGDFGALSNQRAWTFSVNTSGRLQFGISNDADQNVGTLHGFTSPNNVIQVNQWNHVAAVYDYTAGQRYLYVNGQLVANDSPGQVTITNSAADVTIGSSPYSTSPSGYVGMIDEVQYFRRALSASEIRSVYNAGIAGVYKSVSTPAGSPVSVNSGGDATATFANVTTPGVTQQVPIDGSQYPALPNAETPLGLYYDISTSAAFTGGVKVCFHLPLVTTSQAFHLLRISHFENGAWVDRTDTLATDFSTQTLCTTSLSSLSPFAIGSVAPTAATVTVSGRVLAPGGGGLRNASVVMTSTNGVTRRVVTNAFGSYTFTGVQSGGSYIMGVESRRFTYATRVVQVHDSLAGVDFTPVE